LIVIKAYTTYNKSDTMKSMSEETEFLKRSDYSHNMKEKERE
jgi:hypothetical protein